MIGAVTTPPIRPLPIRSQSSEDRESFQKTYFLPTNVDNAHFTSVHLPIKDYILYSKYNEKRLFVNIYPVICLFCQVFDCVFLKCGNFAVRERYNYSNIKQPNLKAYEKD